MALSPLTAKKHFSFGLSPHANWVRFRIEDLLPEPLDCADHFQLCFNYASFDDIRIYLPLIGEDRPSRLVLKALGAIMRKNVRTSDYPCRIGGEEFAVLMLHTDVNGAGNVAERIRQGFEESSVGIHAGNTFLTTISVGIAGFQPGEAGQSFFNRADKALYRAKEEGRNRVVISGEL